MWTKLFPYAFNFSSQSALFVYIFYCFKPQGSNALVEWMELSKVRDCHLNLGCCEYAALQLLVDPITALLVAHGQVTLGAEELTSNLRHSMFERSRLDEIYKIRFTIIFLIDLTDFKHVKQTGVLSCTGPMVTACSLIYISLIKQKQLSSVTCPHLKMRSPG